MSQYVVNTFDYVDSGVVVRKQTWQDSATGQNWDTFDPVGPAEAGLQDGTVVNQPNNPYGGNQGAADAYTASQVPPAQQPGNNPVGMQGATYNNGDRTSGTNTPQSGVSTAPVNSAGVTPMPTGGNPGGPFATNPGAPSQELTDQNRNMFLYNPANPTGAMANVLRGMGFNPGAGANPFSNMLMRYAPGLGSAFNVANVNSGRSDIPEDLGGEFGSFIQKNLQGAGGSMASTFGNARAGIGDALNRIQGSFGQNQQGQVNPFVEALKLALDANGTGMGLPQLLQNLASPYLTPQMGQAYGQGLQGAANQGMYDWANSPAFGQGEDQSYWLKQLYNGG